MNITLGRGTGGESAIRACGWPIDRKGENCKIRQVMPCINVVNIVNVIRAVPTEDSKQAPVRNGRPAPGGTRCRSDIPPGGFRYLVHMELACMA
jgi:hypothetical protein